MRKTILLISLCLIASAAMAQFTLEQVFIQVQLHHDGSATVTETRQAQIGDEGTEGYITFNDMGDIEVRDLQVWDDQETAYVTEEVWNVDRSRAEKAGRCGYNRTSNGVEICWGIGDAGQRLYKIRYTLTNLVKAYDDYDGFCHSFYEAANSPAREAIVAFKLEDDSLTRDKAAIWTFGYEGIKGFVDELAYAASDSIMHDGESIIVLLQLNKGVLDPAVQIHDSFTQTVKRQALEGSDYDLEDAGLDHHVSMQKARATGLLGSTEADDADDPMTNIIAGILVILVALGGCWFILRPVIRFIRDFIEDLWYGHKEKQRRKALIDKLLDGKKYDDLPYYRDLPLGGNLLLTGATLGTVDGIARDCGHKNLGINYGLQQLFDAFILRMIYKNQIQLAYDDSGRKPRKLFRISKPVQPPKGMDITDILADECLRFSGLDMNKAIDDSILREAKRSYRGYINDAGIEYQLQKLLYDAAGDDHLLQPDELKEYAKQTPLASRKLATVLSILAEQTIPEKFLVKDNVHQAIGFLHYLRDFSLVKERSLEETGLWKEYLVYASLFGIADQVRRDMKKVTPDAARLNELLPPEEMLNDFRPLKKAIKETVKDAYAYQTPQEAARIAEAEWERERQRERSSGGSGRSSYSGGGGHSGGGGSGFR